ncbi:helix-turn-helix domain-containing protein [Nonomuraea sp. bgisy101]|uniref:helix-turn-helix domain-containing protein n=1 Tax=Nonomuraea sp. bgisy101 TaxID=3413784 RepID=UPI003D713A0F
MMAKQEIQKKSARIRPTADDIIRDIYPGNSSDSTQSSLIRSDWLRETAYDSYQKANQILRGDIEEDLRKRGAVKARMGVPSLLEHLAIERGMSWSDIARLVNVSISAVRKWRTGGQATPDNRKELARLASFLDLLGEFGVEDPASWMEVTLDLPAGYFIRPVELYVQGYRSELLDIARGHRDAAQVLDGIDPTWRDSERSTLEVYIASDGHPALRFRDS